MGRMKDAHDCGRAIPRSGLPAQGRRGRDTQDSHTLPTSKTDWDLVAHPVTQVIGEQALVDILDLSEVAWTCWGVSTPRSGLGLRMV